MYSFEKILNEITFVLAIVTMGAVFLYQKDIINLGTLIFLCVLTILVYLSSRTVNNNNSKISEKEKNDLIELQKELKKGKKKNGEKNSSNSRKT